MRHSLYRQFVDRFRPATRDWNVVPVTTDPIDAAESAIGGLLPESYRAFVTGFGAGYNLESALYDLRLAEVFAPNRIVQEVGVQWVAPIPAFLTGGEPIASDVAWKYLTPFGSEPAHGYWFCFPRDHQGRDDAPVYHFSHDGGDIVQAADGFDDMIQRIIDAGPAKI